MKFKRRITSSSFKSDVAVSFAGAFISRLIVFLSLPLLTQIYSPTEYGIWPLLLVSASFLIPLATLRYEIAIILPRSENKAIHLLWAILISTSLVVVLSSLIFLNFKEFMAELFNLPSEQQPLIVLVSAIVLFSALQQTFQAWLVRKKAFALIAASQIVQVLIMIMLALVLPKFFTASASTLVFASLAGLFAAALINVFSSLQNNFRLFPKRISLRAIKKISANYKVYPFYMVPYALSAGLTERVFQIALAGIFSISSLGMYFVARQLVFTPMSVFTTAIRQVFFSHISGSTDKSAHRKIISKLLKLIASFQMPLMAFGLVFAPKLIDIIIGSKWENVGDFIFWLIIPASVLMHTAWLDRVYDVYGRQRFAVVLQLTSDFVLLSLIALVFWFKFNVNMSVAILSLGIAIYNIIWLWITLGLVDFSLKYRAKFLFLAFIVFIVFLGIFLSISAYFSFFIAIVLSSIILCGTGVFIGIKGLSGIDILASKPLKKID